MKSVIFIIAAWLGMTMNIQAQTNGLPANFYKHFSGTIDGEPVSVTINKINGRISGKCDYLKSQKRTLLVFNSDSSNDNTWYFDEQYLERYAVPSEKSVWKGTYRSGKLYVHRLDANSRQNHPFILVETYPEGVHRFTYLSIDTTVHVGRSATGSIRFDIPKATGGQRKTWINQEIGRVLGIPEGMTGREFLKHQAEVKAVAMRKQRDRLAAMDSTVYVWGRGKHESVFYNRNGYVVLMTFTSKYTGKEYHYKMGSYCFDVKNRKLLAMDDIIHADKQTLIPILNKYFSRYFGLKQNDTLKAHLPKKIDPMEAIIAFHQGGLIFSYNQALNLPEAKGIISFRVPWKALEGYLNPEFARRMGLTSDNKK